MRKIEKIVETCNECVHCRLVKSDSDNHNSATICTNENAETPFLLMYSNTDRNVLTSYDLKIPDNCPLEDYQPKN